MQHFILFKKPTLLEQVDSNSLKALDELGCSLLQALTLLGPKEKVFEEFLEKCLNDPEVDLTVSDNFGNSLYDFLIINGQRSRALHLLERIHATQNDFFTEDHASLLENKNINLEDLTIDIRQNGISYYELSLLKENYVCDSGLLSRFREPEDEELNKNNISHLTAMETCFYLYPESPTKIWPILMELLHKSSKRIFFLKNHLDQNIFHLCAKWGDISDFNKLWQRFSSFAHLIDHGLRQGQGLEYYKSNNFFQNLLKSLDSGDRSPLTYLIDRFIKEKKIDQNLFQGFLCFENMKTRKPLDVVQIYDNQNEISDIEEELSENGIAYLLSKSRLFSQGDFEYVIKTCCLYDSVVCFGSIRVARP